MNFPIPYHDEILYSVIARFGTRRGITSPKQLLDEVFDNRHVIATIDLPNQIKRIADHYPPNLGFDVIKIIYAHTLFPIYAPFTTELKRRQCIDNMENLSNGSIHLGLGVNASRIKRVETFRYCPLCLEQQLKNHGEFYWLRQWHIRGIECCLEHHIELIVAEINFHMLNRHAFLQATPILCPSNQQSPSDKLQEKMAYQINILLNQTPTESASFEQWSQYYAELARKIGNQSHRHKYSDIKSRILQTWPQSFLSQYGLQVTDSESCWLRSIFRKHRKSFSYLEHIVALEAFLPHDWSIAQVLAEVASLKQLRFEQCNPQKNREFYDKELLLLKRNAWIELLKTYGILLARQKGKNGKALYAWLYRNDKQWLMKSNFPFRKNRVTNNLRVNWNQRDCRVYRQLLAVKASEASHPDDPRHSRHWYLSHLMSAGSIEKNLYKLPLTNNFLSCFSESISQYQIRRIKNAIKQLELYGKPKTRWRVLRLARLSEERLTEKSSCYINRIIKQF